MDAFSYLSVLISVILGLAITQVLQGYRALALNRGHVRWYWPSLAWSGIVILVAVQNWWSMFGLAGHANWNFAAFAAILVHTGFIYMLAALILPDAPAGEPTDLQAHYFREVPPFFGIALVATLWSGLREWVVEGHFLNGENLVFHSLFLAISITALATRNPRVHAAIAGIMAALYTAYIALLFARLG